MSIPPNLELKTEVQPIHRRDFYVADPTLLNPINANPLVDGEWLELDANYKAVRGSGEAAVPSWICWAERGRYDTQAIGKVPLLFLNGFEAITKIVDLTGITVGEALVVQNVTIGGLAKRGLAQLGAGAGEHLIIGYATRVFADRLQFWCPNAPNWKSVA